MLTLTRKRGVWSAPLSEPQPITATPPPRPHAWEGLVRRLFSFARGLGASEQDSEELVQETVLALVHDPRWYDPRRGEVLSLLRTALRNRFVDGRRRQAVRGRAEPLLRLVEDAPLPEHQLRAAQAAARRRALVELLSASERLVFRAWLLQRQGALTGDAAAHQAELSPAAYEAAKKRLRRRLQALLVELELQPGDLFDGGAP